MSFLGGETGVLGVKYYLWKAGSEPWFFLWSIDWGVIGRDKSVDAGEMSFCMLGWNKKAQSKSQRKFQIYIT
jgi:hypothetical protein